MLPSERQKKILELIATKKVVTIPDLMKAFDISIETVRRDLTVLDRQGSIQKIYGGAKAKEAGFNEPAMESRMINRALQKDAIGKKCGEFISDGDCIFIDSGTTTYYIAKYLTNKKNLTIITNSIPVVNELLNTDFEIILIGGRIRHSERSVVAFDYIFDFSQLNIQKSFIGAGGISITNGVSDYNMQEAVTRKNIIERSKKVYVAADSSKFDRDVTINIAGWNKIDCVITDAQLSKNIVNSFKQAGLKLILAE